MWASSVIPYISLFCYQQTHTVILIFFLCIFTLYIPCFLFLLIDHNQKQVLLIKSVIFFWSSEIFFCSFQLFGNGHIHNVVWTLINLMKLDVENNSIVSTLSNVVNISVEIDERWFDVVQRCTFQGWHTQSFFNVDLTLSDLAMSYYPNSNVETTLKGFLGIDECC